jgi:hypothetical protein
MNPSVFGLKSHDGQRTPHEVALDLARQLAGELVDPPVHPDLVPLVDHQALLVGMQQRDDPGHEERRLDVVAPQQIEDARHPDPRAVLTLGELPGRDRPLAQGRRLVVGVEGQRHADPRPVLPPRGPERSPRPHPVHSTPPTLLVPGPSRLAIGLVCAHGA